MDRAEQLAQKRLDLQARAADQRAEIAAIGTELYARLGAADRMISIAGAVAKHPIVSIAAIGATLKLGPWRILRWLGKGAFLLGAGRRLYAFVSKQRDPQP
jgi:hypothetical protein